MLRAEVSDPVATVMSSRSFYVYLLFKCKLPGANSRAGQEIIAN